MAKNVDIMCPVCMDLLKDPKSLTCGHTFCSKCLVSHFRAQDSQGPLSCPLCRQHCPDVASGTDILSSVASLSINEAVCDALHQHGKEALDTVCRHFKRIDVSIEPKQISSATMTEEVQVKSLEVISVPTSNVFLPVLREIRQSFAQVLDHIAVKGDIAVYPTDLTQLAPEINDYLQQRIQEVSRNSFGLCYISKSMAAVINSQYVIQIPEGIVCDACIVTSNKPPFLLTIVHDKIAECDRSLIKYSSLLTRAVLSSVLDFTNVSVTIHGGIVSLSQLKEKQLFAKAIQEIEIKSSAYCIANTLKMDDLKCRNIVNGFLRATAAIRSTWIHKEVTDKDELWFLTSEQFIVLTENIDKNAVFVNALHASGSTVLMVEVANRLERTGRTLLICESRKLADKAKEVCSKVVTSSDFNAADTSGLFTNIVAEANALKTVQMMTGRFKHIWIFHSKECSLCESEGKECVAVMWCQECKEALCDKHVHNHSLISAGASLYCRKHTKKEIELYCKDCREEICMICSQTKHKTCKHISCISDS